jgi:precorrin-6B methylase 2
VTAGLPDAANPELFRGMLCMQVYLIQGTSVSELQTVRRDQLRPWDSVVANAETSEHIASAVESALNLQHQLPQANISLPLGLADGAYARPRSPPIHTSWGGGAS